MLAGSLVGWRVVGQLVGWLVGWAGCLVGCLGWLLRGWVVSAIFVATLILVVIRGCNNAETVFWARVGVVLGPMAEASGPGFRV